MREIKFRVFDKCLKSMHIVGEDTHDSLTCYDGIVQYYNLQNGEGSGEYGDYILMQYTGLKDKNGREIYEGDIVVVHEGEDFKWTHHVEFFHGGFWVTDENCLGAIYEFCEVVGNIYENPELLEGSE